ncbi:MAG: hypothetical protein MUO31_13170 [Thermodesulfovibrionales bacterium]|nr:hypothetical protein [Thermodesulfovibrionales bacterium]
MASRFTQTEKWDDKWFRQLSPNAKVLYWYIWDKCNIAGFWEVDLEGALFHTKIPQRGIEGAYKELARGFLANGDYVWIRKFLYHQRNLPLNENNPSHRGILKVIDEFKSIFPNVLEETENQLLKDSEKGATKGLISPLSIGIGKGKGKGKGISKEDEKIKFLEFVYLTKEEIQKLTDLMGEDLMNTYIEDLNNWMGSKGKRPKSHYFTIRAWHRKDLKEGKTRSGNTKETAMEQGARLRRESNDSRGS